MRFIFALFLSLAPLQTAHAEEPIEPLKIFTPFIGTWTSAANPETPENKFTDISRWEWAFGGKVVRITHSVNGGAYAGETLIHWDAVRQQIIYRYVNNGGFYTDGVISERSYGSILIHEFIRGFQQDGPTETRAGYSVRDGKIYSWTQFKRGDIWGEKSNVIYEPTPHAVPIMPLQP